MHPMSESTRGFQDLITQRSTNCSHARLRSNKSHGAPNLLYSCVVVGCHLRRKVFESAVSHEFHNPKVGGSNLPPATNLFNQLRGSRASRETPKTSVKLRQHGARLHFPGFDGFSGLQDQFNNLAMCLTFAVCHGLPVNVHRRLPDKTHRKIQEGKCCIFVSGRVT